VPKVPAKAGRTGSPTEGEPVYLAVGLLRRPHGLHGDILMEIYTDFPERLCPGKKVHVGEAHLPLTITRRRKHNHGLLLAFRGYDTLEAVGSLRNSIAYVPATDLPPLPDGRYYHHQLLGSSVVDESGRTLGTLTEILTTGANDVYVVEDQEGRELLLPAIRDVVLEVDLARKEIRVHLIPGLVGGAEEA
jgi:16S rRNA processing protein RimM